MSEYITLLGADDVRWGGCEIRAAAERIQDAAQTISAAAEAFSAAASRIDSAVENHAVYLNEFIANLKAIMGADHA